MRFEAWSRWRSRIRSMSSTALDMQRLLLILFRSAMQDMLWAARSGVIWSLWLDWAKVIVIKTSFDRISSHVYTCLCHWLSTFGLNTLLNLADETLISTKVLTFRRYSNSLCVGHHDWPRSCRWSTTSQPWCLIDDCGYSEDLSNRTIGYPGPDFEPWVWVDQLDAWKVCIHFWICDTTILTHVWL